MPIRPRNIDNVRSVELGAAHEDHEHAHADLTGVTSDQHHAEDHAARHADGGADELDAANLASGAATDGQVLTADGVGAAAWEAASGHGGHVTNGDAHDHVGGDGAQIDHGGLAGLADDDHTQYLNDARHDASHSAIRVERATTAQTITDSTFTTVIFNSIINEDDEDGDITHNTTTGIMTINTAGWYSVAASIAFSSSPTGERIIRILRNATTRLTMSRDDANSSSDTIRPCNTVAFFAAADTIAVDVFQDSGSDRFLRADDRTALSVMRVRS